MNEHIKSFLNQEQDPKAVEKVTAKLRDLLMKEEEIGYIGVQKKPVTVLPDSVVLTNKRIVICKPKNLGLSMEFTDYSWDDIAGVFVKENILGSEFSFSTKTDINLSMDYLPKVQARKIYTFAKERIEEIKGGAVVSASFAAQDMPAAPLSEMLAEEEMIEEVETEEVTHFAELMPAPVISLEEAGVETPSEATKSTDRPLVELSKDELFEKLQNYKKLLDNGLIRQAEYDALKDQILPLL